MQRIGHILPSTTLGADRWAVRICAPVAVETAHPTARAALAEQLYGPALTESQTAELGRAAQQLAHAGADAVVWNGESCGLHGVAHARAVVRAIEATAGVPASTVTLGQLDLLARRGLPSLALIVPGSRERAGRIADTYLAAGLRVSSVTALGLATAREAAELPVARLRRLLLDADTDDARCVVVAGTELPVAPVAALVERELGKPVFDGARVAVHTGLQLLGLRVNSPEWGVLFTGDEHAGVCCDSH
ncbi:aspartate/glutamate racemase family protein [Streptomyces sp. NPDC058284]|uniref:aspartate racemase/maleate isomerase family protein n=1 Tax=unclassified Streptomyces TaxID=2593676 RepID=UPI0036462CE1